MVSYRITAIDSSDGFGVPAASNALQALGGEERDAAHAVVAR
jgi:hypothetical protein